MSTTRVFRPPNRLALVLGGPNDPSGEELAAEVARRLESLKDGILAYVDTQLLVFRELARAPDEVLFAECRRLEAAARGISEVAGTAGLSDLGEAARGVDIMVSALAIQGAWHSDALKLHIEAVTLLAADPAPSATEARQMLSRLRSMRDRIGIKA